MLGGWAYGAIYGSSRERTAALDGWLWHWDLQLAGHLDDLEQVPVGVIEDGGRYVAHGRWRLREADAEGDETIVLGGDVLDGEGGVRDTVLDEGCLEWPGSRVLVRFEDEFHAVARFWRDDRQPAVLRTQRDVGLLLEAECPRVEVERPG